MTIRRRPPRSQPFVRVTIALDILDAFFGDAEIGLSELATTGRRDEEHDASHVRRAGGSRCVGENAQWQVSARRPPPRVRATRHHPFGAAHTGLSVARRASQRDRRDRATRRPLRRRRALLRTRRRPRRVALQHRGGQAIPCPSFQRRKGDRRVSTRRRRGADQGRHDTLYRPHDRHPADVRRRARQNSTSAAMRSASTKARSAFRRSASRFATSPTAR